MIRDLDIDQLRLRDDARPVNEARLGPLSDSIAEVGLMHPIRVRAVDGGFEIIAGAHRIEAHKLLGLAEISAHIVHDDDLHAELAGIDENLLRTELTPTERARQTARRKAIFEELHPNTRQGVAGAEARHGRASDKLSFAQDTAKATGQDLRTVQRAASRGEKIADTVLDMVRNTPLDTGMFLDSIKNLSVPDQIAATKRALAEHDQMQRERRRFQQDIKKARRADREQSLATKQKSLPSKKFGVIYADPEWEHEPWSDAGMDRAAANKYPVSSVEQIKSRDVASIAANDCALFMWTTVPHLEQAFEVINGWGFAYKSSGMWRKQYPGKRQGMGYWFRINHEILIVATRGNVPAPAMGTQFGSVFDAEVGEHSAKPNSIAEMIETYFPNLDKIELNRRGLPRPGWYAWGNEVEGADENGLAYLPLAQELHQDESSAGAASDGNASDEMPSPDPNDIIRAEYAKNTPVAEIAGMVGLKIDAVRKRASRMGLGDRDRQKAAVAASNRKRSQQGAPA